MYGKDMNFLFFFKIWCYVVIAFGNSEANDIITAVDSAEEGYNIKLTYAHQKHLTKKYSILRKQFNYKEPLTAIKSKLSKVYQVSKTNQQEQYNRKEINFEEYLLL